MALEQGRSTGIALNVTRTRVTVLTFNLTIISVMLSIYWVYADAWHLQYAPADQPMNMLNLFALQFTQPLLWFR